MRIKQLLPGRKGCCVYLLYSLIVLVFLLWFLFPADAVRIRVESDLNRITPGLKWRISSIGLALPADIQFRTIKVSDRKKKEKLFNIDAFSLRPDFRGWKKTGKFSFLYRLRVFEGDVSGTLHLAKKQILHSSKIKGIRFDSNGLKKILKQYKRTVSSSLSGNFTGAWEMRQGVFSDLTGSFRLDKGKISLQEPILGMEQLVFEQVVGKVKYDAGMWRITEGKLESKLLSADFGGTLQPHNAIFSSSQLTLKGSLFPRSEFMASLGNAALSSQLKQYLREGRLPFTINGLLKEPGVSFTGLPNGFNKRLQERGR